MPKSDNNTAIHVESTSQFDIVEQQEQQSEPDPAPILLSCDNVLNCNGNPSSSSLSSEVIITDLKTSTIHLRNEITETQNNVKDANMINELKQTDVNLQIDPVEKSDNSVLRKLLRKPRYFDTPDNNWGNCYNCREAGHTVVNCTAAKRKKPCFICGSLEHNVKQCKQGKDCYICKKGGHRAKNCPEKSIEGFQKTKLCLKCGDYEHEMFTCKNAYSSDDLKEIQCYICKCFGHLCCVDYGKGLTEVSCYRCGQLDHTGLECTSAQAQVETTHTTSPIPCYKCGEQGHKARKCPTSTKKRKRKSKDSRLKDMPLKDNVGVKSAPHEPVEARKKTKTQNGHSKSSQPEHSGGWANEDPGGRVNDAQTGSPLTPSSSYRSKNSFHYGAGGYGSGFEFEASGSNGFHHKLSKFGDSSNHKRRENEWDC